METKVLIFDVNAYNREPLEKLSDEEKYRLASVASTVGYNEADVLSLDEFSRRVNDGTISVDYSWLYFVNVKE